MFLIKKYFKLFEPHPRNDGAVYASVKLRFLAIIIDLLIIALLSQFIFMVLCFFFPQPSMPISVLDKRRLGMPLTTEDRLLMLYYARYYILSNVVQCGIIVCYLFVMCFYQNQTPAKMLFKIKVVDEATLARPSFKQCLVRTAMSIFSLLPLCIGMLWLIVSKKNQTWHDAFARTIVVRVNAEGAVLQLEGENCIAQTEDSVMSFIKAIVVSYHNFLHRCIAFLLRK